MNEPRLRPPLNIEGLISQNQDPDGHISSVSLLLSDANQTLFALHVATDANYIAGAGEFGDLENGLGLEPVFVVPQVSIDRETISNIVNAEPPLLSMFLVAQER